LQAEAKARQYGEVNRWASAQYERDMNGGPDPDATEPPPDRPTLEPLDPDLTYQNEDRVGANRRALMTGNGPQPEPGPAPEVYPEDTDITPMGDRQLEFAQQAMLEAKARVMSYMQPFLAPAQQDEASKHNIVTPNVSIPNASPSPEPTNNRSILMSGGPKPLSPSPSPRIQPDRPKPEPEEKTPPPEPYKPDPNVSIKQDIKNRPPGTKGSPYAGPVAPENVEKPKIDITKPWWM